MSAPSCRSAAAACALLPLRHARSRRRAPARSRSCTRGSTRCRHAQPIENATVVIRDGKVQAVGAGLAPPAGARVIDVEGRIVTPGLMSAGSQLGLVEVGSLPDTRDYSVASGALGAAFDVQYALNAEFDAARARAAPTA